MDILNHIIWVVMLQKNCNVSSCNNGWQECRKCFGKGQIKGTEYVKNVREVPGTVKKVIVKFAITMVI